MLRSLAAALLSVVAHTLAAQQPFVAPDANSIVGSAEAASTKSPSHLLYVTNGSSIPIVVYTLALRDCVNVVQQCVSAPISIAVPAGARGQVGRLDASSRARRMSYQWTFAYRPDTSDAGVIAVMRAHGLLGAPAEPATNVATQTPADTAAGLATPSADPRARITAGERSGKVVLLDSDNRPVATSERYRFKVAYGSILGSTKGLPGAPLLATGACIDPAQAAALEKDATISRSAAHPPVLGRTGFSLPSLPPALRDSSVATGEVVVQWVVDTTGNALPGSVQVLESPHALMSVAVCGAAIGSHLAPATDANGKPVRAWVQMPVRFVTGPQD